MWLWTIAQGVWGKQAKTARLFKRYVLQCLSCSQLIHNLYPSPLYPFLTTSHSCTPSQLYHSWITTMDSAPRTLLP